MKTLVILLASITLTGCVSDYDLPRREDGRIDERQLKRDIDIDISERCRFDIEKERILCECRIEKWWCEDV